MSEIPEAVRVQAVHPFRELPDNPNTKRIPIDGAIVTMSKHPGAQIAWPTSANVDVPAIVEQARDIAREHEKDAIAWWIAPEHDALAPALEDIGVVNKDTPGFEATENAMALVHEPRGKRPADVEVRPLDGFDEFLAVERIVEANFGYPEQAEENVRQRYEEFLAHRNGESMVALVDGRVVGSAYGAFGPAGINLFGGSVLEDFRGRGIYRALTFARWDMAVERGTPALTVQAGKMSMPILEKVGFEWIDAARVFVDELAA